MLQLDTLQQEKNEWNQIKHVTVKYFSQNKINTAQLSSPTFDMILVIKEVKYSDNFCME